MFSAILALVLAADMITGTAKIVELDDAPAAELRTYALWVPLADPKLNTRQLDDTLAAHDDEQLRICVRGKMLQRSGGVDVFVRRSIEQTLQIDLSRRWRTRCATFTVDASKGRGVQVTAYGPTLNRVWVRNVQLRSQ